MPILDQGIYPTPQEIARAQDEDYVAQQRADFMDEELIKDFYKYRIETTSILDEIEHKLKGEVFDYAKRRYEKKYDPWINEEGINVILSILYAYSNKSNILSRPSLAEIYFMCRSFRKDLAKMIFKKGEEFQIQKERRTLMVSMITNSVFLSLLRSKEGKEAEQLTLGTQRHEITRSGYGEQEKKGFFPNMFKKIPFVNK